MPSRKAGADSAQTRLPTPTAASSLATTATATGAKPALRRPANGGAGSAPTRERGGDERADREEGAGQSGRERAPTAGVGRIRVLVGQHGAPAEHADRGRQDEPLGAHGFHTLSGGWRRTGVSTQLRHRIFRYRSSTSKH